jgi:hypothetical protein
VIRFGGASGIVSPAVLDLPQFQVGGMLCGDRTVQLAAYDAIYTIQLDATNRPVRYDSSPWLDRGHTPPQFVGHSENLGAFNPAARILKLQRISLGPVNGRGQYLLEMNANAISSERCASIVTTTRIVRTDRNGREVQQFQLYQGQGVRECGE